MTTKADALEILERTRRAVDGVAPSPDLRGVLAHAEQALTWALDELTQLQEGDFLDGTEAYVEPQDNLNQDDDEEADE